MSDPESFALSLQALISHLEDGNGDQAECVVEDAIVFLNRLLGTMPDSSKFGARSDGAPFVAANDFGIQRVSDTLREINRVHTRLVDGNLAAALAASRTALEKWEQSPGSS